MKINFACKPIHDRISVSTEPPKKPGLIVRALRGFQRALDDGARIHRQVEDRKAEILIQHMRDGYRPRHF